MIEVRGVTKSIDTGTHRVEILKGIDLEIPRGQFAAILGASGSGKSCGAGRSPTRSNASALLLSPVYCRKCCSCSVANNFTSAPGQVKGDFVQTNIDAKTSLDNPEAFGRLVVLNRGDALIRLSDIAEIELGPQSADSSSVFDGLKAVFIGVYATPTANPLTVITNVRKAVPEIQRELPVGLEATIAYDAATGTERWRAPSRPLVRSLARPVP